MKLPVDCVCNCPRCSFASACRVYATFGLHRSEYRFSGRDQAVDLSTKIHQLHAHANSLRENHPNLDHQLERTPSTAFRPVGAPRRGGAIRAWCRQVGNVSAPYEGQGCEFQISAAGLKVTLHGLEKCAERAAEY